jgi:hypothetical protein
MMDFVFNRMGAEWKFVHLKPSEAVASKPDMKDVTIRMIVRAPRMRVVELSAKGSMLKLTIVRTPFRGSAQARFSGWKRAPVFQDAGDAIDVFIASLDSKK